MLINLKVKTLDALTHDFSIDNEITIRQFKEQIAEKTNIAAENQRIIYQGRVLADDKLVREYDVDGKVLHLAERPPFSQRGANATNNDEPMRGFRSMPGRPTPRNMRNAPYFRALDGMLVGTMAIPVNNSPLTAAGSRTPPNRFPTSSSFCINRITVAEHMIDCANNIAAYLENPEIGLNNQPLDILQRGHWTMESTVVEVGVSSADMPRNNNIIDMVQDAVTAALSRNTPGRNYAVVQLPTVYTNEEGEQQQQPPRGGNEGSSSDGATSGATASSDTSEETTTAAAVIIEDVLESDDEAADGVDDERSSSPQTGDEAARSTNASETPRAAGEENTGNSAASSSGPSRRTHPQVLASVFQRYRTVETRLAPFFDRYYEIMQQDPNFEESDTAGRDNAQRIFDRVSEALHYLSHAQHAISDLMLDLSQPGPRVLTCRPILVEQSGYIRSNNIFTPNLVAAPLADLIGQVPSTNDAPHGVSVVGAQSEQRPQSGSQPVIPVCPHRNTSELARAREEHGSEVAPTRAVGRPVPRGLDFRAVTEAYGSLYRPTEQVLNADDELMAARVAAVVAGLVPTRANHEDPIDEPMMAPVGAAASVAQLQQQQPRTEIDAANVAGAAGSQSQQPQTPVCSYPSHRTEAPTRAVGRPARPVFDFRAPSDEFASLYEPTEHVFNAEDELMAARVAAGVMSTNESIEDPVDEPMVAPVGATPAAAQSQQGPVMDPLMQLSQRIRAAVDSIRNDPDMMSINLPVHVMTAAVHPQGSPAAANNSTASETGNTNNVTGAGVATAAGAAPGAAPGSASTSSGTRSGEQRANTLPTTATQTRSTARPQIQIGGNNNWAGRIAPTHTAFDRFLPCNSHHIRETETLIQTNNNTNNNNNNTTSSSSSSNRRAASNAAGTTAAGAANTSAAAAATNNNAEGTNSAHANSTSTAASASTAAAGDLVASTANAAVSVTPAPPTPLVVRETSNLRTQLRSFLQRSVFQGEPVNEQTMPTALCRCMNWFGDCFIFLPQYERPEWNSCESVRNILRHGLREVIELCTAPIGCGIQFEQQLKQMCDHFRMRIFSVLLLCLGSVNAELYWHQVMRLISIPLRSYFCNESLQFLRIYINPTIPAHTDIIDARQFLVLHTGRSAPPTDVDPAQQSLDNDIEMTEVASSSNPAELEPALPTVVVGSEPWHTNFPNHWLPVITRDLQTQAEQNRPQPTYSDAYISGMSAKRRKIIQSEKPPANVESLIASGVQRALQSTGLGATNGSTSNPVVNPDVVINAISHDGVVQASYTEAVRSNARERLKNDVDYKPSKYPQIAKFTEQK